jgi:hypothetical protein
MGKGNKPKAPEVNYNTALTEAKKPSPQEDALGKASLKTLEWADRGDYRDPRAGGLFVNYANPAILKRNRALQTNAGGQGIFAMGTPDVNYLASLKENQAAEDAETDAAQYESDIREGVARAAGVAGDVAGMDTSRKMNILGTTSSIYSQDKSKPKWWEYMLGGAMSAGSAALSNPALKI